MPGKTGFPERSRAIRLSRNSSFTRRVRSRSSEKLLFLSSPNVWGKFMDCWPSPTAHTKIIRRKQNASGQQPDALHRVTVGAGLLARAHHAPQLRQDILVVLDQCLDTLGLRPHRKERLLEVEIDWKFM